MKGSGNYGDGNGYAIGAWTRFTLVAREDEGYNFWVDNVKWATKPFSGGLEYTGGSGWIAIGMRDDSTLESPVEPAKTISP